MKDFILENEHILLRPLTAEDFELFLPYSLNEPETWHFSPRSAAGEENLREYMNYALTKKEEGILRQDTLMLDGRFRDTTVLSILQNEWQGSVKAMLMAKLAK